MSSSKLDQVVKGAPPPGTTASAIVSQSPTDTIANASHLSSTNTAPPIADTPSELPSSSPSQIYLNLLILEASLRSQYLTLRDRRRQNTFFIFLLSLWIASFTYLLFLRPREDGSGIGGSVYWVVETSERVALMGGIVTAVLIWGTGQWDRGVRWPRRWLSVANRGLRNINAKIVIIRGPWWRELFGHFVFLFPYSALFPPSGSSYSYEDAGPSKRGPEDELRIFREEDLSPGGDHIKLLLLPKPFGSDFRENWEFYRLGYWEKENERRAKLRQAVRKQEKEVAKLERGWLRWARWGRGRSTLKQLPRTDSDKVHHKPHQEKAWQRGQSSARAESQSRNASRSSTSSTLDADERPSAGRTRRGSTTIGTGERRRKPKSSSSFDISPITKLSPISRPA